MMPEAREHRLTYLKHGLEVTISRGGSSQPLGAVIDAVAHMNASGDTCDFAGGQGPAKRVNQAHTYKVKCLFPVHYYLG